MNMNRVGIFWDYENCAPPSGTPGYVVAERLRATCNAHGSVTQFRAYLELSAPPPTPSQPAGAEASSSDLSRVPTSPKTLALRSEIQSSGVSLIDCPHNSRKNVADSMLACDLVCFALDNPTPQTPCASYLPTSPYSIPNTFSALLSAPAPSPKTTIVLVSGDRDFAYPLAVLKARKYDVGLIVPPGGAHPSLRAQATWVMNWKDVLEGGSVHTDGRYDVAASITPRARADNVGMDGQIGGITSSTQGVRRPSFASRRGSISSPRRGSVSNPLNTAPPPPHLTTTSTARTPTALGFSTFDANEGPSTPVILQPPPEGPCQLPSASRSSRKSPLRRPAAKAGSRPPSRAKSRPGPRPNRPERIEQENSQQAKPEQPRPHPLIVPVPLTASPIGSAGPSLAGMSPRAGRTHTPPLFSTSLASHPPPAAPPALPSSATPPIKVSTPPAKPPTPPRDVLRAQRLPIPHVATPRPPIPESSQSVVVGAPGSEAQRLNAPAPASISTLVAPTPKPGVTALQSLLPAAAALRPPVAANPTRPVLALPLSIQSSNTSTLAPATPVTPPASPSPPHRWARLQPVHDDTDGDGERPTTVEKKRKEKAKERTHPVRSNEIHSHVNLGEATASCSKKNSTRLAVQVGMVLGVSDEPSSISGVDSILRSYTERSPKVEQDDHRRHSPGEGHHSLADPVEQKGEVSVSSNPTVNDDDEEEEQFHEMFLATFSRPSVGSNAPRTPATVKLVSLELATEERAESAQGATDHKRPRITTPRPVPRTSHSLPTLIPIMQSLLAGVEGGQPIASNHSDMVGVRLQSHKVAGQEIAAEVDGSSERLYHRANSPPPIHRRRTSPSMLLGSISDMMLDPLVDETYREFRFLISVLERCRWNGQERPLRSLIGAEFTRDVFEQVRATSFRDHVQRAVVAGVVSVGGGPVQGREWISLNRNWQGLGLVRD